MKVLIVDDDKIVRLALQRVMEMRGHGVLVAESGEEGLIVWMDEKPDCVLLDVMMPGMSGLELLEKKPPQAFVCVISAYSGVSESYIKKFNVQLFVSKPFDDIFKTVEMIETEYENYRRKI